MPEAKFEPPISWLVALDHQAKQNLAKGQIFSEKNCDKKKLMAFMSNLFQLHVTLQRAGGGSIPLLLSSGVLSDA